MKISELKARELVSEIVREVDYDIWKGLFENPEEPDEAAAQIQRLINIVRSELREL